MMKATTTARLGLAALVLGALLAPPRAAGQTPASTIQVRFTNRTDREVSFFLNGGRGLTTKLAAGKGETYTVRVDPGTSPYVGIAQSDGKELRFSLENGKKYAFKKDADGKVKNFFDANEKENAKPADSKPAPNGGGTAAGTGSALTAKEAEEAVEAHNKARKDVGVAALKWSNDLAKFAQEWADELARTGKFEHRPRDNGRWNQKYGENLAGDWDGKVTGGIKLWTDEKPKYTPGTTVPGGAEFQAWGAGHYTQMVWKNTTEVGIGKAVYQTGPMKGMAIIVANYNPPGNYIGQKPY